MKWIKEFGVFLLGPTIVVLEAGLRATLTYYQEIYQAKQEIAADKE